MAVSPKKATASRRKAAPAKGATKTRKKAAVSKVGRKKKVTAGAKKAAKKTTSSRSKTSARKKPVAKAPARKKRATAAVKKATGKTTKKTTPKKTARATKKTAASRPARKTTVKKVRAATGKATVTRSEPTVSTARLNAESYKKALSLYAKAMSLVQQKSWKQAAVLLADFISQHARERELCQRARTYLRVCSSHMAGSSAEEQTVDDYCLQATVLGNDGKLKRALNLLEKALAAKPGDAKALYLKASTLALMGNRREALKILSQAISADEQNRIYATNSPDFADLRDDEEFITLTTREDEEY